MAEPALPSPTTLAAPVPDKPWYYRSVTVTLFLIFFFPVGLILMWAGRAYPVAVRVLVSAFFGLMIVSGASGNRHPEKTVTGNPSAPAKISRHAIVESVNANFSVYKWIPKSLGLYCTAKPNQGTDRYGAVYLRVKLLPMSSDEPFAVYEGKPEEKSPLNMGKDCSLITVKDNLMEAVYSDGRCRFVVDEMYNGEAVQLNVATGVKDFFNAPESILKSPIEPFEVLVAAGNTKEASAFMLAHPETLDKRYGNKGERSTSVLRVILRNGTPELLTSYEQAGGKLLRMVHMTRRTLADARMLDEIQLVPSTEEATLGDQIKRDMDAWMREMEIRGTSLVDEVIAGQRNVPRAIAMLELLHQRGVQIDEPNSFGGSIATAVAVTPRYPAFDGTRLALLDLQIIDFLISKGCDINKRGTDGNVALHSAAGRGNHRMVEQLIMRGADVNAPGKRDAFALKQAVDPAWTHMAAAKSRIEEIDKRNKNKKGKESESDMDARRDLVMVIDLLTKNGGR